MIISHEYKFIFIKTVKTAGTSVEIALSKFCGPNDVITPIMKEDEETRKSLGHRGPQNYFVPFKKYELLEWPKCIFNRKLRTFYNHVPASYIRSHLDLEIWDSYFKFCFERNPWDKAVSWYYWLNTKEPRPSVSKFVQSGKANKIVGFDLYTINAELVVDRVFFYEALDEAMEVIAKTVGLPEIPTLPNAKSHFRKDRRSYRDILSLQDKEVISKAYAREIAIFGYEW